MKKRTIKTENIVIFANCHYGSFGYIIIGVNLMNLSKYKMTAHRGLYDNKAGIPENSLDAFSLAIAEGYAIELDVHITTDGELIVFHDNNLHRMTGVDLETDGCTLAEIKKLRLLYTDSTIPTLAEVLELVNGQVPLLIETKTTGPAGELEEKLVAMLDSYKGDYMIQSFNPLSLIRIRRRRPEIPLGQLLSNNMSAIQGAVKKFIFKKMLLNPLYNPDFLSCYYNDISPKIRASCEKNCRPILCWTVRGEKQIEKYRELCDGLIFEK